MVGLDSKNILTRQPVTHCCDLSRKGIEGDSYEIYLGPSRNSYASCTLSPSAFGKSCLGWDWTSVTLYTLAESFQFWCATRGDSQARHETLWLVHHRLLKKRDLNEMRHECRGYTRGSKARRVFPSTFSLALSRVPSARVYSQHYMMYLRPIWNPSRYSWQLVTNLWPLCSISVTHPEAHSHTLSVRSYLSYGYSSAHTWCMCDSFGTHLTTHVTHL